MLNKTVLKSKAADHPRIIIIIIIIIIPPRCYLSCTVNELRRVLDLKISQLPELREETDCRQRHKQDTMYGITTVLLGRIAYFIC